MVSFIVPVNINKLNKCELFLYIHFDESLPNSSNADLFLSSVHDKKMIVEHVTQKSTTAQSTPVITEDHVQVHLQATHARVIQGIQDIHVEQVRVIVWYYIFTGT